MHPSRAPGPFWPKRAPDRTPITTDCCVLRRGLKSGPREPQRAEDRTRSFFEGSSRNRTDLQKISQNTYLQKTMCFTRRNGRRAKSGGLRARNGSRVFSKKVAPLQRQGPAGTKQIRGVSEECPGSVRGVQCWSVVSRKRQSLRTASCKLMILHASGPEVRRIVFRHPSPKGLATRGGTRITCSIDIMFPELVMVVL